MSTFGLSAFTSTVSPWATPRAMCALSESRASAGGEGGLEQTSFGFSPFNTYSMKEVNNTIDDFNVVLHSELPPWVQSDPSLNREPGTNAGRLDGCVRTAPNHGGVHEDPRRPGSLHA